MQQQNEHDSTLSSLCIPTREDEPTRRPGDETEFLKILNFFEIRHRVQKFVLGFVTSHELKFSNLTRK